MDLSILQRSLNKENIDSESQSLVRPKLSFSVASLLASAANRSSSPRNNDISEENHDNDNEEEDEINPEDSDDESDVSVDSHGEDDNTAAYNSRLNDSSDVDQDLSASSPTRYFYLSLFLEISFHNP